MTAILMWLGSFLSGPLLKGALDAYKAKLTNDNNVDQRSADLMARELAVQQREVEVQSQERIAAMSHPLSIESLFGYVTLAYYAKLLVYDKMLGWGTTDSLQGWALIAANLVIGFYFGKRTIESAALILRGRK